MSKASPTRKMILIGCFFRGVSILLQSVLGLKSTNYKTRFKIQMVKLPKMATVADLGIERHDLRKFYDKIDALENLLKCPKCQKIVGINRSKCAFCNDEVSAENIRETKSDSFVSALRQLKYLTNYNEAKTEEDTTNVEPTEFGDCSTEEDTTNVEPTEFGDCSVMDGSKVKVTWDERVEQTWTEFKQYVNHKEDYTAKEIINYLTQKMNTRKMKKSSKDKRGHYMKSTMNNLKSRLSTAYKNETGRSFQNDFSEVNDYCKSVGITNNDHKKAYLKKKEKMYKDFVTSTEKGLNFDEVDLQNYCDTLKNEQMLSFNSAKLNLASIKHGYQRDTGLDFKATFPAINKYIENLYKN